MYLDRWLQLLTYLTLGLSCCALVFAEAPFLPDLQIYLAPLLALLLVGWWAEGRWSLPNAGANILAILIVASGAFWILLHRHDDELVLAKLPWALALLPYMGPLLMAALLVKVFRTRDPLHFWHVQGLALLQVALGCMLEGGPAFGAALAVYLASALASLALHYRLAASRAASGVALAPREKSLGALTQPRSPVTARTDRGADSPGARAPKGWLLSFTSRWALLIAVPAFLLFLLTPRGDNATWEPLNNFRSGRNRIRVGVSKEGMNLNNTGRLEMDDEIALHVVAVNAAGQPKLDLPVGQRWRSSVLDWYEKGTWVRRRQMPFNLWSPSQRKLPDFGNTQFTLTFTVQPRRAGSLVLAEPIRFGPPSARLPVLSLDDAVWPSLFAEQSDTVLPSAIGEEQQEHRYRQVVPGGGDPSRTPAEGLRSRHQLQQTQYFLTSLPSSLQIALKEWTTILLRRLSQQPRYPLPAGVRAELEKPNADLNVAPEEWEATARVLSDYLAHSGEFTYTLDLARRDRTLDPILDFLLNIKKGHCERYAAALTAILRSVRIPARIVKGFRGWDSEGGGAYTLRHHHAHAWVEILVLHPRSLVRELPTATAPYDWLALDPTPPMVIGSIPSFSLANLWYHAQLFCVQTWQALIVDYNGDEQADLWSALQSSQAPALLAKGGLAVLALGVVAAAWLFLRRLRLLRRHAALRGSAELTTIYLRLVYILRRYISLRPAGAQTPREYGEAARAVLAASPPLAALAGWPRRVIELFYRVRFGGQPLRDDERQTLDNEFARFTEALRQHS